MITTIALSPAVDKIYFADDFSAGGLYRIGNVVKSAGGKGINVARVASLLGEKVASIGFKAGESGEWLFSKLNELGITARFISVEGESRTNNNIIDRKNNTETEVLEIGPFIKKENITAFLELYEETLNSTEILICSGGTPEGIPTDFYKELINIAYARGIKVILDTSNEMLEEGIKAKPFIIKPNLRELSKFVNRSLDTFEEIIGACKYINSLGVKIVVASLGKEGAVMVSEGKVISAKAPEISVVNTIGSGDSMVAGLAVGLVRGRSLEDVFCLGMACAVANTQFEQIGFISTELVEKYLGEIRVERIL